jgi:hypothetical protein
MMKKHILLLTILFISTISYAQYDFLKESLNNFSSAPSYLIVKVKSPSYEGEAAIFCTNFYTYYMTIYNSLKWKKYINSAYYDIKNGKYFTVSDEDFEKKDDQYKPYYFEKIIVNDSVLYIAKKGIEFFIRTYFDEKGRLILFSEQSLPCDYFTIVKIIFDAGIQAGIGSEWSNYYIQDSRFYNKYEDKVKFIIPPEYRDSKE